MISTSIHCIKSVELGPVEVRRAGVNGATHSYSFRRLTIHCAGSAHPVDIDLYSESAAGLMTDLDREARPDSHPEPLHQTDPDAVDLLAEPVEPSESPTTELDVVPMVVPDDMIPF